MTTYLTEDFFALLLEYSQGKVDQAVYQQAVESTLNQIRQRREQFEDDFPPGSPEMPESVRGELAGGLGAYIDALRSLEQLNDPSQVQERMSDLQRAVKAIRSAQQEHQRFLSEGPTMLPFLNRFLLHYEAARRGEVSPALSRILEEHPTFLQWMSRELEQRPVDPSLSQLLFQLRQFFITVGQALEAGEELPEVYEDIVEIGSELADGLLLEPHSISSQGPTPISAVNRIFEALGSATGDHEELGYLISIIDQCKKYLRTVCPTRSDPRLFQALARVLRHLDAMEECLQKSEGFDALVACAEGLEKDTIELADQVEKVMKSEAWSSPLYEQQTSGLPDFFRSHLLPAYKFVDGSAEPESVVEAAEHLEASAAYFQSLLNGAEDDGQKNQVEQALALVAEVSGLLRSLAESGEEGLLSFASGACAQATSMLQEAGVPLK